MAEFSDMIQQLYPDAVKDHDYTIKSGKENGTIEIDYWNTEKLGTEPDLMRLHTSYMRTVKELKKRLPMIDDSDPAPWLNASKKENPVQMQRENSTFSFIENKIPVIHFDSNTGRVTD